MNGGLGHAQIACGNGEVLGFCNGNQCAELRGRGGQLKPWAKGRDCGVEQIKRPANALGKLTGKGVRENTLIAAVEECCAELALYLFKSLGGGGLRDVAGA